MSQPQTDWVGQLFTALTLWQQKQFVPAQSAFHRAEDAVSGQESALVWSCFMGASLSRLLLEMGDYREAEISIARSRDIFREQGYQARMVEIEPHLNYLEQLCRQAGLEEEANCYAQTVASGVPVFLGAEEMATPFDPRSSLRDTGLMQGEVLLPTLAGSAKDKPKSWEELVERAAAEAVARQGVALAFSLEEARQRATQTRAKDQGLRLLLCSWLETICYFMVGDYASSSRSVQDIPDLWLGLSLLGNLPSRPEVMHLQAVLSFHQMDYLTDKLLSQFRSGQCPTLDPWTDLQVQFAQLGEHSHEQELLQFESRLTGALVALSGQSRGETEYVSYRSIRDPKLDSDLQALLAGFERRRNLGDSDLQKAGQALLFHVQSHIAWAQNQASRAALLEKDSTALWIQIPQSVQQSSAYSLSYQRAVDQAGLTYWLAQFPEQLEFARGQLLEMHQFKDSRESQGADTPELDFWDTLKAFVAELQAGQHSKAERALLVAKSASHGPSARLLTCWLHNLQAVVEFQRGDLAAGHESWGLAKSCYPALSLDADEIHKQCWIRLFEGSSFEAVVPLLKERHQKGRPILVDPQSDLTSFSLPVWTAGDTQVDERGEEWERAENWDRPPDRPSAVSKVLGWFRRPGG